MSLGVVAIVGSPNVGKSTIFNRIVGHRRAIVDDQPGVTRDRLYETTEWLDRQFRLIDTGGIEIENRPFQEQIRVQTQIAIDEADVIIFVADGKKGVTNDDRFVAKMLFKTKKPVILAVNKIDNQSMLLNLGEFYSLGLGEPIATSGEHGIGIGDILDKIIKVLPNEKDEEYDAVTFSIIGRPNVGKSSLVNALYASAHKGFLAGTLPCTACRYCTEYCPMELDIPMYMSLYNEEKVNKGTFYIPMALKNMPEEKLPTSCVGCGSCEAVCPQSIKISDMMSEFCTFINK